jgi:hypothetical protein
VAKQATVMYIMRKTGRKWEGYPFGRHVFARVVDSRMVVVAVVVALEICHNRSTINPEYTYSVASLLHVNFRKSPVVLNGILDTVQEICLSGLMYFMPYEPFCAPKKTQTKKTPKKTQTSFLATPLCDKSSCFSQCCSDNSTNYPIVASLVSCLYGRIMCYSKRETSARNTTCNWLMAKCVVE